MKGEPQQNGAKEGNEHFLVIGRQDHARCTVSQIGGCTPYIPEQGSNVIWACIRIVKHMLVFVNHLALKACMFAELSPAIRQRYYR